MVEIKNILKNYGRQKVLKGIDLSVKKGEILGIIGPNGAGKTTLMRIMAGIKKPGSGSVKLFGLDPLRHPKIKSRIGFMPERVYFNDEMTGELFLKTMSKFCEPGKSSTKELMETFGIDDAAGKKIRLYSKGMVQRLLMAQAFLNDPELLLLDEPNSGIDPIGTKEIRDIILQMNKQGKTFIINSHQLTELERICSRVVFLAGGQIVDDVDINADVNDYLIEMSGNISEAEPVLTDLDIEFREISTSRISVKLPDSRKKKLLEALMQKGIEIETFQKRTANLEELFIKHVKE